MSSSSSQATIGGVAREMSGADETIRQATAEVFAAWTAALGTRLADAGLAPGG